MTPLVEVLRWREEGALQAVPAAPGVLCVELSAGPPYLGKTADLRRRLMRLLRPRGGGSRRLLLREAARRVSFRLTGSAFEADRQLYESAKLLRPGDFREYLKLRPATFVKLLRGNRFPRSCLTQRLTRGQALFYGPFPDRSEAERFQSALLDLFRIRRCVENLDPSPSHPGCVWGEMQLCLRPCQAACGTAEYAAEVQRLARFLATDGESLVREAEEERDRASAALEFEAAARQHRVRARAKQVQRLRGELCGELGALHGAVLQRSAEPGGVELTPVYRSSLQASVLLKGPGAASAAAQLAREIREAFAGATWTEARPQDREDHLALLQRWHRSSFRRGEFVRVGHPEAPPVGKLAQAAIRVASGLDRPRARAGTPQPMRPAGG